MADGLSILLPSYEQLLNVYLIRGAFNVLKKNGFHTHVKSIDDGGS